MNTIGPMYTYQELALKDNDYESYLLLHDQEDRLTALLKISNLITSDEDYFRILGETIRLTDHYWNHSKVLYQLLESKFIERDPLAIKFLMTFGDRIYFRNLAQNITVYRGCHEHNQFGFSWTLDIKIARQYSVKVTDNRLTSRRKSVLETRSKVIMTEIDKSIVYSYWGEKDEHEIFLNPLRLDYKKIIEI